MERPGLKSPCAPAFMLVWILLTGGASVSARDSAPPTSATRELAGIESVMVHSLEPIFPEQLLAEDAVSAASRQLPQRFALPEEVEISPQNHGTWELLTDGDRLWRLRIDSPFATDLNFGFSRFRLPAGATLHLVSLDHDYFQGPYGAADNRDHGELWTPVIPGGRAVIELYVPADPEFEPELELRRIGRGYRDLFKNTRALAKQGSCNIDVICPEADAWRDEIQSVAVYSINGHFACSGNMVMDESASFTPYFLTAYHCGVTTANDQSVVTYWNYQSPSCGQLGGGTLNQSIQGSTMLARRQDNDFCLLELDGAPPAEFNVYWTGWDRRELHTPQGSVTIHHPGAQEKAISFNDDALTTRGSCIIPSGPATHWHVDDWELGSTEDGSSGGGLWDPNTHLLVGYLTGGLASCADPDLWDCYGRFAVGWDGDASDQRLRDWLDPDDTGALTVAGAFGEGGGGGGGGGGGKDFSCGNAGYDNDSPEGTAWFQGGRAGDPDFMFGVRFELTDFGYLPGQAAITGFCASNAVSFPGGPWPNEVFIYPDVGGIPDDSQVLGQGTIVTGDGTGDSIVMLAEDVPLAGNFWLMNRGDPMHADEDFNMEFDAGPNTGNSFQSISGVTGLTPDTDPTGYPQGVNYMLRAYLQPAGSGPTYTYLVAGMARIAGREGTDWRSTLVLLNRSGGSAIVTLSFVRKFTTVSTTVNLADGELRSWNDVITELFGLEEGVSGAIKVESNRPLVVTARTYNLTEDGTYGQFLPGIESSEAFTSTDTGVISQLKNNDDFRSNVGFINLSGKNCTVRVQLYDSAGMAIGSPIDVEVRPMGWSQINDVFAKAGAGSHDDAYARVEILSSDCVIWGYASVADNNTGDPTTIPMEAEQES